MSDVNSDNAQFNSHPHSFIREMCHKAIKELQYREADRKAIRDKYDAEWDEWRKNSWWYRFRNPWICPIAIDPFGFERAHDVTRTRTISGVINAIDMHASVLNLSTSTCSLITNLFNDFEKRMKDQEKI